MDNNEASSSHPPSYTTNNPFDDTDRVDDKVPEPTVIEMGTTNESPEIVRSERNPEPINQRRSNQPPRKGRSCLMVASAFILTILAVLFAYYLTLYIVETVYCKDHPEDFKCY